MRLFQDMGTSNNIRFRRFLLLSEQFERSCQGESPIGRLADDRAVLYARRHTESTRERTQAGAAAIRSS